MEWEKKVFLLEGSEGSFDGWGSGHTKDEEEKTPLCSGSGQMGEKRMFAGELLLVRSVFRGGGSFWNLSSLRS